MLRAIGSYGQPLLWGTINAAPVLPSQVSPAAQAAAAAAEMQMHQMPGAVVRPSAPTPKPLMAEIQGVAAQIGPLDLQLMAQISSLPPAQQARLQQLDQVWQQAAGVPLPQDIAAAQQFLSAMQSLLAQFQALQVASGIAPPPGVLPPGALPGMYPPPPAYPTYPVQPRPGSGIWLLGGMAAFAVVGLGMWLSRRRHHREALPAPAAVA
jgi:hypothetical protein